MTVPPPAVRPVDEGMLVEEQIARLLFAGTLVGVALLAVGVALMITHGISPTGGTYPVFDGGRVIPDLLAARPEGFLWAGIVVLVATPIARVLGELAAFALRGDRRMVAVALAILGIIASSVALAIGTEG